MGEVVAFQYGELDASIIGFIHEVTGRIRVRLLRSSLDIIEIGRDLTDTKEILGHGVFLAWIEAEFAMTERTAQRMMDAYAQHSFKYDTVSYLEDNAPIEALYALIPPDDIETLSEIKQQSQNGEIVTATTIKELRAKNKKLREERDIARLEGETRTAFTEETSQKLHEATCEVQYLTKEIERITKDNTVEGRVIHDDGPLRQALMGFWRQLPQETQDWFLNEVVK